MSNREPVDGFIGRFERQPHKRKKLGAGRKKHHGSDSDNTMITEDGDTMVTEDDNTMITEN